MTVSGAASDARDVPVSWARAPVEASFPAMLVSYLVLEALWFGFAVSRVYTPLFAEVQGDATVYRPAYGVPAYAILVWALWVLVVGRAESRLGAARDATAFALAVYGVYNLANMTTFKRYPLRTAALDAAWGVLVINAVAQLSLTRA